jgi:hypothetical protein
MIILGVYVVVVQKNAVLVMDQAFKKFLVQNLNFSVLIASHHSIS